MDSEMHVLDMGDFEIERRMETFARARLSPDPQVVARTRARVMREARIQHEAARDAARAAAAIVPLVSRRSTVRRLAMPLLAASMWLGIAVGTVAATQAGGALYPTRLLIEHATLPTGGAERIAAEIERLDARLADALSAAARGDAPAVAAALAAYDGIADETCVAAAGNAALESSVAHALGRHRMVLTAVSESLGAKGNATAAAAVETAIERSIEHNAAVIDLMGTRGRPDAIGTNANGAGGPGATGAGATGQNGGAGGGANGATGPGTGPNGNGSGTQTGGSASGGKGEPGGTSGGQSGGNGTHSPKPTAAPTPTPDAPPTHEPRGRPRADQ